MISVLHKNYNTKWKSLNSFPADVRWGSFVTHSFLNECVTNEPQRTSAGRLEVIQPRVKNQSGLPVDDKPSRISLHEVSQS